MPIELELLLQKKREKLFLKTGLPADAGGSSECCVDGGNGSHTLRLLVIDSDNFGCFSQWKNDFFLFYFIEFL